MDDASNGRLYENAVFVVLVNNGARYKCSVENCFVLSNYGGVFFSSHLLCVCVCACVRVFVCCMSLARLAVYRWNVVGMNILYWHAALRVSVKQFIVKMVTLILAAHELTLTLQGPLNFLHFNDETILFSRNYNGKNIPWKCFADFTEESAKRCAQFWIDGNLPNENEVRLKPVNDCQNALFGCERITIDPRHIHIKFH